MLVFPAMILLLPLQAFGSESTQARAEIHRIKAQKNLSGQDKAQVAYKYIKNLSDEQFMALLQQLGAERFLARLPGQGDPQGKTGEERSRPPVRQPEQAKAMGGPSTAGQPVTRKDLNRNDRQRQQQQLETALRHPQKRERLTRAVTNYLLNTASPGKTLRRISGCADKMTASNIHLNFSRESLR